MALTALFIRRKRDPFHIPPAVQQEAAVWRLRLRDDDPEVREAFERWLDEDPSHRFADAEADAFLLPADLAAREVLAEAPLPVRPRSRIPHWAPLAASVMLAVGVAALNREAVSNLGAEASTAHGETRTVELDDGSKVTLNARSAIDVDFSSGRRHVRLRRGEAYFDVAHDPGRPFTVQAGDAGVRVVGTAFNVRLRSGETTVTVDRGVVDLTASKGPSLRLTAGRQAFAEHGRTQLQPNFEPLEVSAWRRGRLVFYETPLGEVVEALNAQRKAPLIVLSDEARSTRFSGGLDVRDPEAATRIIAKQVGARVFDLPGAATIIY